MLLESFNSLHSNFSLRDRRNFATGCSHKVEALRATKGWFFKKLHSVYGENLTSSSSRFFTLFL
jgi:hypothetical protein